VTNDPASSHSFRSEKPAIIWPHITMPWWSGICRRHESEPSSEQKRNRNLGRPNPSRSDFHSACAVITPVSLCCNNTGSSCTATTPKMGKANSPPGAPRHPGPPGRDSARPRRPSYRVARNRRARNNHREAQSCFATPAAGASTPAMAHFVHKNSRNLFTLGGRRRASLPY
jgi:hypothetical protein